MLPLCNTLFQLKELLLMAIKKGTSSRELEFKKFTIRKILEITGDKHSSDAVKNKALDSIVKIVSDDQHQKNYLSRFFEPILLSLIASLLWENGIKKVAAWLAATFLSASMVTVLAHVHVALNSLLL